MRTLPGWLHNLTSNLDFVYPETKKAESKLLVSKQPGDGPLGLRLLQGSRQWCNDEKVPCPMAQLPLSTVSIRGLYRLSQPCKNYNLTFSINNFQNNESIEICFMILKLTYSAFCRKPYPIWFSSHEEIGIFVRYVISPFNPSFDKRQIHTTQWTRIPHRLWMVYTDVCRKLGWKGLVTYLTKINFFVTTEPKPMGVSPICR